MYSSPLFSPLALIVPALCSLLLIGCQTDETPAPVQPIKPVVVAPPPVDERQPVVTTLERPPLVAQPLNLDTAPKTTPVTEAKPIPKIKPIAETKSATEMKKAFVVPRPRPNATTEPRTDLAQYAPPPNVVVAPPAPAPVKPAVVSASPKPVVGKIKGEVKIMVNGKTMAVDEVMISAEPLTAGIISPRPAKKFRITMKDKTYSPSHLLVQAGDTIEFTNRDHFKHNVFSSSKPNVFDLGTYGPAEKPTVKLTDSGLVKVYCNIHPNMAAFVMVAAVDRMTLANKNGQFQIDDLPAGRYRLTAWNIRADWQQEVEVAAGETQAVTIVLDGSQYQPKPHLNKLGKPYPPQKVSFDDDNELY